MMSGPMDHASPTDPARTPRLPDRARWLCSLSPQERDALGEMTLREVDERFARWREEEDLLEEEAAA